MRTVLVRLIQIFFIAAIVFIGYRVVQDTTAAQDYHAVAMKASESDNQVLGPAGIGKLTLGMSPAQARATGQVDVDPDWTASSEAACNVVDTDATSVHFSRDHGLAAITAAPSVKTPEGIGAGASIADVTKAYPAIKDPEQRVEQTGYLAAKVPGNPAANYIFVFRTDKSGPRPAKIQTVLLALDQQGAQCTGAR